MSKKTSYFKKLFEDKDFFTCMARHCIYACRKTMIKSKIGALKDEFLIWLYFTEHSKKKNMYISHLVLRVLFKNNAVFIQNKTVLQQILENDYLLCF